MRSRSRPDRGRLEAIGHIEAWTRARFRLGEDIPVTVSEVACGLPGCPPLETIVAFWTAPGTRHQFKVFKPVNEVAADDLPPSWMRDALIAGEDDWGCC